MTETDDLLVDWKAVYAEQNPTREPERMQYSEAMLAGFTLIRRELRMAQPSRQEQPTVATPFKLRGKIIDALAKHNPKDAE